MEPNEVTAETIQAVYNSVKDSLLANGMEHGAASVVNLPDGTWIVVARPLAEAPLEADPESTPPPFQPGGGGFGGGGASGKW